MLEKDLYEPMCKWLEHFGLDDAFMMEIVWSANHP